MKRPDMPTGSYASITLPDFFADAEEPCICDSPTDERLDQPWDGAVKAGCGSKSEDFSEVTQWQWHNTALAFMVWQYAG